MIRQTNAISFYEVDLTYFFTFKDFRIKTFTAGFSFLSGFLFSCFLMTRFFNINPLMFYYSHSLCKIHNFCCWFLLVTSIIFQISERTYLCKFTKLSIKKCLCRQKNVLDYVNKILPMTPQNTILEALNTQNFLYYSQPCCLQEK